MTNPLSTASADPDRITVREAMRIADCSRSTLYRHFAEVPHYRIGGRTYTSRAAVEALAARRGVRP